MQMETIGKPSPEPRHSHSANGFFRRMQAVVFGQLLVWTTKLCAAGLLKVHTSGQEHIQEYIRRNRPIILAGWHGHNFIAMLTYYTRLRKLFKGAVIMVPESKNGMVIDYFGKRTEFDVIKVKSRLGPSQWARATVAMIKFIRAGHCALLSPDGPSGPEHEVKPGVAVIAQQTKAVIITASAAARRGFQLKGRWDRHVIPIPFTRTLIYFSEPIDTAPSQGACPSTEELQERIKFNLTDGVVKAEKLCRKL